RQRYIELSLRLHRALGRRPWEEDILGTDEATPPEWMRDEERVASWRSAWALRRQLEAAVEAAKAAERAERAERRTTRPRSATTPARGSKSSREQQRRGV